MEVVVMTPILTSEAFAALGAPNLVYVKPVSAKEVLGNTEVQEIEGIELDPEQTFYALYGADGQRLAVMMDRESAVAAAVAHELAPVSVH
ncbi:MAG TPA: DUF1150 family protein [Caulobacteraceae bacterium]|jgi:hypothetical protein